MLEIKKILYPTDFSKYSEAAFSYAYSLAKKFKAKIDIINVVNNVADISDAEPYIPIDLIEHEEENLIEHEEENAVSKRLKIFCDDHFKGNENYETHIAEGMPYKEIIKAAMQLGSDIIVMGTHGYTGLDRILIGSTAERVVRESPIPVLTVRGRIPNAHV